MYTNQSQAYSIPASADDQPIQFTKSPVEKNRALRQPSAPRKSTYKNSNKSIDRIAKNLFSTEKVDTNGLMESADDVSIKHLAAKCSTCAYKSLSTKQ